MSRGTGTALARRAPAPKPPTRRAVARTPAPAPPAPTCGALGGVSADTGLACDRMAPGGTARCADHDEAAVAMLQGQKKGFLDDLASGTVSMTEAARRIGKDPATIWRWRQADPAFDAAFVVARDRSDGVRTGLVEDSLFKRIVEGKAAPAETIFFLKNRGADRWKDRVEVGGRMQHTHTHRHEWKLGQRLIPWT